MITVVLNRGTFSDLDRWSSYAWRLKVMDKLAQAGVPVKGVFFPELVRGTLTRTDRPDNTVAFTWEDK